jgi:radical SAM-linked protein
MDLVKQSLIVRFRVFGNLRFLSHRESSTMLERALVRSGIKMCYSQGFNPHPRYSLPLPRSVSVESDDEMLCVLVEGYEDSADVEAIKTAISEQLPAGCEITSVSLEDKCSYQPVGAVYEFRLNESADREAVCKNVGKLAVSVAGGEEIIVERISKKRKNLVQKNVGEYINSVEYLDGCVVADCVITGGGSIRIEELMTMFGVEAGQLDGGVKRKTVQWRKS